MLKQQAPKTFQGNEHQKIILKDANVKKFTVTSTKRLFSKEDASKKSSKRQKPKNYCDSDKSQRYFQYNTNQKNVSTATSVKKNHSLIDQRHKIFKGTSAKKHFQMDNCQKSFSKRKDRQAPQNHFQSDRHQIRFQNDKCQKIFSKTQTEKTFLE